MADRWYPVKRRRPPIGLAVLVCGDGLGNVHMGWFCGKWWWSWDSLQSEDGDRSMPYEPTHWRHAPKAARVRKAARRG